MQYTNTQFSRKLTAEIVTYNNTNTQFSRKLTAKIEPYNKVETPV